MKYLRQHVPKYQYHHIVQVLDDRGSLGTVMQVAETWMAFLPSGQMVAVEGKTDWSTREEAANALARSVGR